MQRIPLLRGLRERAALSQEDLAKRSGVARATIADLEAGKRPARPSTLRKVAQGLGVEVTDLYEEHDVPARKLVRNEPLNCGPGETHENLLVCIKELADEVERLRESRDNYKHQAWERSEHE